MYHHPTYVTPAGRSRSRNRSEPNIFGPAVRIRLYHLLSTHLVLIPCNSYKALFHTPNSCFQRANTEKGILQTLNLNVTVEFECLGLEDGGFNLNNAASKVVLVQIPRNRANKSLQAKSKRWIYFLKFNH